MDPRVAWVAAATLLVVPGHAAALMFDPLDYVDSVVWGVECVVMDGVACEWVAYSLENPKTVIGDLVVDPVLCVVGQAPFVWLCFIA